MQAINIYTDRQHPYNYIVRMDDGSYRVAAQALTSVYGNYLASVFEPRLKSKAWDGKPTAQEITGVEGRLLLNTLNAALVKAAPKATEAAPVGPAKIKPETLEAIEAALVHARTKHPFFAHKIIRHHSVFQAETDARCAEYDLAERKRRKQPIGGDDIIMVEIFRALECAGLDNREGMRRRLASVAAIAIRMLEGDADDENKANQARQPPITGN